MVNKEVTVMDVDVSVDKKVGNIFLSTYLYPIYPCLYSMAI